MDRRAVIALRRMVKDRQVCSKPIVFGKIIFSSRPGDIAIFLGTTHFLSPSGSFDLCLVRGQLGWMFEGFGASTEFNQ